MHLPTSEIISNLLLDIKDLQTSKHKLDELIENEPYARMIFEAEQEMIDIESYLAGELSETEKKEFEKKLKEDHQLQEKTNLYRKIDEFISIECYREKLNEIHEKIKGELFAKEYSPKIAVASKNEEISFNKWLVAASIALMIGAVAMMFTGNPARLSVEKRLYAHYYEPFKIVDNDITYLVNSSGLDEARIKYKKGEYRSAYIVFDNLPENIQIQTEKHFYKGLTLMEMDAFDQAIKNFNHVLQQEKAELLPQAYWYLGLCYLQTNQKEKAREIFSTIKSKNIYNSDKAGNILKALK